LLTKIMQKSPSAHNRTILSGYVFVTKVCIDSGKKMLNSNISSTRNPHDIVNVGPLAAEIDWWVWGTPANCNGFRVLALIRYCTR